jgi:thioredoxin 1
MGVIHIGDESVLDRELSKSPDRLVVIDFTATWCGPCKMIGPIFEQLSNKYLGVAFLKVDVDECGEIAMKYQVQAMPTFVFFKNKKEVDRLRGADGASLEAKVKTHGGPNATQNAGFTGSGQRLGFSQGSEGTAQDSAGAGSGLGGWFGNLLGGGGSGSGNANQNASAANDNLEAATKVLQMDPNLPKTKVQVRLADGSKFTVQVNLTTPVSRIREFICTMCPDHSGRQFGLNTTTSFPAKEIVDESITINDAGLANSVVVQSPKV